MKTSLGLKKLLKGGRKEAEDNSSPQSRGLDSAAGSGHFFPEDVAFHPDADEGGGLACTNEELLKAQREAITQWIKSMGKRLLTGSINLINTPFPVNIFEPRSYLEKLADVWVYPRYLTAAAQANDPVERMKLVVSWFIAGLHHAFENWRKPFNPILGETWQAQLSDGTAMFMEQISHHPPVSVFHMEGPGGIYTFRGLSQPTVSIVVKYYGFKTVAKGFRFVNFPDGTRIELHYPQYCIKNVVYSSRPRAEVDGQAILVDPKNKLKAVLSFGPLKHARNRVLRRSDAVYGYIYDCSNNQASLDKTMSAADAAAEEAEAAAAAGSLSSISVGSSGNTPGAGGPRRHAGGAEEDDEEHFESASESEWDASKEAGEASELEQAAVAAAAEAMARDGDGVADEGSSGRLPTLDTAAAGAAGLGLGLGRSPQGSSRLAEGAAGPGPSSGGSGALLHSSSSNGVLGGLPGGGSGAKQPKESSFFSISGFGKSLLRLAPSGGSAGPVDPAPDEGEGLPVCSVEGSWLGYVDLAGKRYWSIDKERPDKWVPVADPLPSDSRYRQDLSTLAEGDLKGAQRAKELLENMQRADKKAREAAMGFKH